MIGKISSLYVLVLVPLNDAWAEYTGEEFGGETNNTSDNTFRYPGLKPCRIDYIVSYTDPQCIMWKLETFFLALFWQKYRESK